MKEETTEILKFVADSLQESKEFAIEQAPDVIQQYLGAMFIEQLSDSITCIFFLILGLSIGVWAIRLYKKNNSTGYSWDEDQVILVMMMGIVSAALCAGGSLSLSSHIPEAAKIHYYPKGYLMEKVLEASK